MDKLANYGSDDDCEVAPRHRKSDVADAHRGYVHDGTRPKTQQQLSDDANYDLVQMEMSEDTDDSSSGSNRTNNNSTNTGNNAKNNVDGSSSSRSSSSRHRRDDASRRSSRRRSESPPPRRRRSEDRDGRRRARDSRPKHSSSRDSTRRRGGGRSRSRSRSPQRRRPSPAPPAEKRDATSGSKGWGPAAAGVAGTMFERSTGALGRNGSVVGGYERRGSSRGGYERFGGGGQKVTAAVLPERVEQQKPEPSQLHHLQQQNKAGNPDAGDKDRFFMPGITGRFRDQIERRKLLWQKKDDPTRERPASSSTAVAAAPSTSTKVWQTTTFAQDTDGKVASKFKRLMGIREQLDQSKQPTDVLKRQEEMFSSMEQQYEVARTATHTMRGVGLGFGSYQR